MGQESTEEVFWYSDRARKDKTMFAEIPQSAWRQFRHFKRRAIAGGRWRKPPDHVRVPDRAINIRAVSKTEKQDSVRIQRT